MGDRVFASSVFLDDGSSFVQEIRSVGEAVDFLQRWPDTQRDMLHEVALRVCQEAIIGLRPLEAAYNAIEGFARKKGILKRQLKTASWTDNGNEPLISFQA